MRLKNSILLLLITLLLVVQRANSAACPLTECQTCSATDSSVCQICNSGFFLQSDVYPNECLTACGDNYYADSIKNLCTRCASGCISCSSANQCSICQGTQILDATGNCQCPLPLVMFNAECLQTCPPQTYLDQNKMECISCPPNCEVCSDQKGCDICTPNMFFNPLYRICSPDGCGEGFFPNFSDMTCQPCFENCSNCIDNLQCNWCKPGFSQFIRDLGKEVCEPECFAYKCDVCAQGLPNECLVCSADHILKTYEKGQSKCVLDCSQFFSGCDSCYQQIDYTTSIPKTNRKCSLCSQGYTLSQNGCVALQVCNLGFGFDPEVSSCVPCKTSFCSNCQITLRETYTWPAEKPTDPSIPYLPIIVLQKSEQCPVCLTGYGPSFDLLECILGNKSIPLCKDPHCSTCLFDQLNSVYYCSTCESGYQINTKSGVTSQQFAFCELVCIDPFCQLCHQDPISKVQSCLYCSSGKVLTFNQECKEPITCGPGTVSDGYACIPLMNCCEEGHYDIYFQMVYCDWPLPGFTLDGKGQCFTPSNYIGPCPEGSFNFPQSRSCSPCSKNDELCQVCSMTQNFNFNCISCILNIQIDTTTNQCQRDSVCKLGEIPDGNGGCITCSQGCLVCESPVKCLACRDWMFFDPTTQGCQYSCPMGYYGNQSDMNCYACTQNCAYCNNATECMGCAFGYEFEQTQNSSTPPQCVPQCWSSNCQTCVAGETNICDICLSGYTKNSYGECTFDCSQVDPMCSACGFEYDSNLGNFKKVCYDCKTGFLAFDSTCRKIQQCNPGTSFHVASGTCKPCSDLNCEFCYFKESFEYIQPPYDPLNPSAPVTQPTQIPVTYESCMVCRTGFNPAGPNCEQGPPPMFNYNCDFNCNDCVYDPLNMFWQCRSCKPGLSLEPLNDYNLKYRKCIYDCSSLGDCENCYQQQPQDILVCSYCKSSSGAILTSKGQCVQRKSCAVDQVFNGYDCVKIPICCEIAEWNFSTSNIVCNWPQSEYTLDGKGGCFKPAIYEGPCPPTHFEDFQYCRPCYIKDPYCDTCGISNSLFQCRNCIFGIQIDTTGFCAQPNNCEIGQYFEPLFKTCMKCQPGCLLCQNNFECLRCFDGQYYNSQYRFCSSKCESGFFADSASMKCFKCMPNCLFCDSADTCSSCYFGFTPAVSATGETYCKQGCFSPNCDECDAANMNSCSTCQQGFVKRFNGFNYECGEDCSKTLPGCAYCSFGWCDECFAGFAKTHEGKCIPSKDCGPGTGFNSTLNDCQSCSIDSCKFCHFAVNHKEVLIQTPTGVEYQKVAQPVEHCAECTDALFPSIDFMSCEYKSIFNNPFCSNDCADCQYDTLNLYFNCVQCKSGFKIANNSTNPLLLQHNNCVVDCLIPDCEECHIDFFSGAQSCLRCNNSTLLIGNQCLQKVECPTRMTWNGITCQAWQDCCEIAEWSDFKQAVECVWPKDGNTLDGQLSCYPSTSQGLGPCPPWMFAYPGQKKCSFCSENDYLCEECIMNDYQPFKCTRCNAGIQVDATGRCKSTCKPGEYADSNGFCLLCSPGCQACLNAYQCLACLDHLFINKEKGSCHEFYDCGNGRYADQNEMECLPCQANCSYCMQDSCFSCNYGFDLNPVDNSCVPGCYSSNCNKCQDGNLYSCLECKSGYILSGDQNYGYCELDCQQTISSCQYCWEQTYDEFGQILNTPQTICSVCEEGFSLQGNKCIQMQDCGFGATFNTTSLACEKCTTQNCQYCQFFVENSTIITDQFNYENYNFVTLNVTKHFEKCAVCKDTFIPTYDDSDCIPGSTSDAPTNPHCDPNCAKCVYDNVKQYYYCDSCLTGYIFNTQKFAATTQTISKQYRKCELDCQSTDCLWCTLKPSATITGIAGSAPNSNEIECLACGNNKFLNSLGKCVDFVKCTDRQIFDGTVCVQIDECCSNAEFSYQTRRVECVWPADGYILDGNGGCAQPFKFTQPCADNQYESFNRCNYCNTIDSFCSSCELQKFTFKFFCKKCMNDLETDPITGYCKNENKCKPGQFFNPMNYYNPCQACPFEAKECSWDYESNRLRQDVCQNGYVKLFYDTLTCTQCPIGTVFNNDADFPNCEQCPSFCLLCNYDSESYSSQCSMCDEQYQLSSSGTCDLDASKCSSDPTNPMIAHPLWNICWFCPAQSTTCAFDSNSQSIIATACIQGHTLKLGLCLNTSAPQGSYFGYDLTWKFTNEGVYPCPLGYAECFFNPNSWEIIGLNCQDGFVLSSQSRCEVSDITQITCEPGFYLTTNYQNEAHCVSCPGGCLACQQNEIFMIVCEGCKQNFILDDFSGTCTPDFNAVSNIIAECDKQSIEQNIYFSNPANNVEKQNQNSIGFYLDYSSLTCESCPFQCTNCYFNFLLGTPQCYGECIGEYSIDYNGRCSVPCKPNQFLIPTADGQKCEDCEIGCSSCYYDIARQVDICAECSQGFYLTFQEIPNCEKIPTCSTQNEYYSIASKSCLQCPDWCSDCQLIDTVNEWIGFTCSSCQPDFTLIDGNCVANYMLPKGLTCGPKGKDAPFFNYSVYPPKWQCAQCQNCIDCVGDSFTGLSVCLKCASGFNPDLFGKCNTKINCSEGMLQVNGECQPCSFDCQKCALANLFDADSEFCLECLSGFTMVSGWCQQTGQTTCNPGFYLSNIQVDQSTVSFCTQCPESCSSCETDPVIKSDAICTACKEGFYLDGSFCSSLLTPGMYLNNGIPAFCEPPCFECTGTAYNCISCIQEFSIKKIDDTLSVCELKTSITDKLDYEVCGPNAILSFISGQCECKDPSKTFSKKQGDCVSQDQNRSVQCATSSDLQNSCSMCFGSKPGECEQCIPGYYLDDKNMCQICTQNCKLCTTANNCLQCEPGTFYSVDMSSDFSAIETCSLTIPRGKLVYIPSLYYLNDLPFVDTTNGKSKTATTTADQTSDAIALAIQENDVIITNKDDLPYQIIKGTPYANNKQIVLQVFECYDKCKECAEGFIMLKKSTSSPTGQCVRGNICPTNYIKDQSGSFCREPQLNQVFLTLSLLSNPDFGFQFNNLDIFILSTPSVESQITNSWSICKIVDLTKKDSPMEIKSDSKQFRKMETKIFKEVDRDLEVLIVPKQNIAEYQDIKLTFCNDATIIQNDQQTDVYGEITLNLIKPHEAPSLTQLNLSEKDIKVTTQGISGTDTFCLNANLHSINVGNSGAGNVYIVDVVKRSEFDLPIADRQAAVIQTIQTEPQFDFCFKFPYSTVDEKYTLIFTVESETTAFSSNFPITVLANTKPYDPSTSKELTSLKNADRKIPLSLNDLVQIMEENQTLNPETQLETLPTDILSLVITELEKYSTKTALINDISVFILNLSVFIQDMQLADRLSQILEQLIDHVTVEQTLFVLLNSFDIIANGPLTAPLKRLRALLKEKEELNLVFDQDTENHRRNLAADASRVSIFLSTLENQQTKAVKNCAQDLQPSNPKSTIKTKQSVIYSQFGSKFQHLKSNLTDYQIKAKCPQLETSAPECLIPTSNLKQINNFIISTECQSESPLSNQGDILSTIFSCSIIEKTSKKPTESVTPPAPVRRALQATAPICVVLEASQNIDGNACHWYDTSVNVWKNEGSETKSVTARDKSITSTTPPSTITVYDYKCCFTTQGQYAIKAPEAVIAPPPPPIDNGNKNQNTNNTPQEKTEAVVSNINEYSLLLLALIHMVLVLA